jgi:hypothetical protein
LAIERIQALGLSTEAVVAAHEEVREAYHMTLPNAMDLVNIQSPPHTDFGAEERAISRLVFAVDRSDTVVFSIDRYKGERLCFSSKANLELITAVLLGNFFQLSVIRYCEEHWF